MESKFTGGLLGLIGVNIVCFFVNLITLTIANPWMICYKERWFTKHTYVDGIQLHFDGTGMQLIGNYIKWLLLIIVTLGIYSFWMNIAIKKWVAKHTHHVAAENAA